MASVVKLLPPDQFNRVANVFRAYELEFGYLPAGMTCEAALRAFERNYPEAVVLWGLYNFAELDTVYPA